jgi:hypothetical protein
MRRIYGLNDCKCEINNFANDYVSRKSADARQSASAKVASLMQNISSG